MFTLWLLQRQLSIKVLEDSCKALIIARVQTSTTNGPIYLVLISICSFIRHTWYNHLYVKISPKFRWTFIPAKETASSWPAISQVNIIVFSSLMLVCPLDTRKVLPLPCLGKLGRFSSAPAQEKKSSKIILRPTPSIIRGLWNILEYHVSYIREFSLFAAPSKAGLKAG